MTSKLSFFQSGGDSCNRCRLTFNSWESAEDAASQQAETQTHPIEFSSIPILSGWRVFGQGQMNSSAVLKAAKVACGVLFFSLKRKWHHSCPCSVIFVQSAVRLSSKWLKYKVHFSPFSFWQNVRSFSYLHSCLESPDIRGGKVRSRCWCMPSKFNRRFIFDALPLRRPPCGAARNFVPMESGPALLPSDCGWCGSVCCDVCKHCDNSNEWGNAGVSVWLKQIIPNKPHSNIDISVKHSPARGHCLNPSKNSTWPWRIFFFYQRK